MKIKRKIYFLFMKMHNFPFVINVLEKLNLIFFHWNEREHHVSYGDVNVDTKYYVIRSRGVNDGLLSAVRFVMTEVKWAESQGYIPFVDFSNSLCQYHVDRLINGTDNAWEYYFQQPSELKRDDIKKKKNVLLSGWTLRKKKRDFISEKYEIKFQPYILNIVDKYWMENFSNRKILGIFIRGTDYVALKPRNHAVQPSIDQMIDKISQYMEKYNFDGIYVVTEDYNYYQKIDFLFKNKVFSYGDNFVRNYQKEDYVLESLNSDPYERGLEYLIRIILLSKCEYTICSKTNGSIFARAIRLTNPIDEYWFELGVY